jgi:hypothetical protein
MIDTVAVLAACCLVLSFVVAVLVSTVPALWWVHLRQAAKDDDRDKRLAETEKDIRDLDAISGRLCKAAGLEAEGTP